MQLRTEYRFDAAGYRESGAGATTRSTRRLLVAGSLRLPLTGDLLTQTTSASIAQFFGATPPVEDMRNESSTIRYDTKLLYLDVRNDVAAYQENETVRTLSSTSQVVLANGDYQVEGTTSDGTVVESRLKAIVDGVTHVLASDVSPPAAPRITVVRSPLPSRLGCRRMSDDQRSNQWSTVIDDSGFRFASMLHPSTRDPAAGIGFAVDAARHVVGTLPVIRRNAAGMEAVESTWNYLSGGDLRQLFPDAPATLRFAPVGAIR